MPELPEMQALAERLDAGFRGATLERVDPLGFSALKTVSPPPESFVGHAVVGVGRRAKYLIVDFGPVGRILIHLSQAGRLDVEAPPKRTRAKGSVVRLVFDEERAWLVREYGTERKAKWWVLVPGDDGPLAALGPEPDSDEFAEVIRLGADKRRVHTLLRDQRTVAGVGRGYADDALHRAGISPYATLASLGDDTRARLLDAIRAVLADALDGERARDGGLSAPKLGDRFAIHRRAGTPCPTCERTLRRISYDAYEVTYCPRCQTGGKVLADRRMSRLVK
ncbi:MAG TPA: DNA-formamidopyrimidine glycosylase family protein [Acidimicrobiia bacterium]|nr:DNA-formamidopyrimidine glycosylase family protein [Acidimicrobiia bacterium]